MKMKTERLMDNAQLALDKAEGVQTQRGIGLALLAIAQEMKLANDLTLWAHGAIHRPDPEDYREQDAT